jgi:probable rRNA maturation factor
MRMTLQIRRMKNQVSKASLQLDLFNGISKNKILDHSFILNILLKVLPMEKSISISLKFVGREEMKKLNWAYRKKDYVTDIISFPGPGLILEEKGELNYLGDIVVCLDYIEEEAIAMNKTKEAHWAHILIHGALHLLGYDHIYAADAIIMEEKEIHYLNILGYPNPYI